MSWLWVSDPTQEKLLPSRDTETSPSPFHHEEKDTAGSGQKKKGRKRREGRWGREKGGKEKKERKKATLHGVHSQVEKGKYRAISV